MTHNPRPPMHDEPRDPNYVVGPCPTCDGDGQVYSDRNIIECPDCGGHGDIEAYDDPDIGQIV